MKQKREAGDINSLNYSNTGRKFFKFIHGIFALVVILWMSNGFFTYAIPFIPNYVRYGIYGLWLIGAFLNHTSFPAKVFMQTWPLLFFLMYLFLLRILVNVPYIENYITSFLYLFIIYSIFLYYYDDKYIKFQKLFSFFLFIEVIYIAANTFLAMKVDPLIARYLAASLEVAAQYTSLSSFKGIGGYDFFYSLVPVILFLVYLLTIQTKKRALKVVICVGLIVILSASGFTIAILFTILFSVLIVINRLYQKLNFKKYRFLILFLLALIIILLSQGIVVPTLINLSSSDWLPDVVTVRLLELATFLTNDLTSGTDLHIRFTLYNTSLNSFFSNVLIGIAPFSGMGFKAGGHSAWLDSLAYYGILSLPMFFFFIKSYKYTVASIPENYVSFYKISWFYFVLLGIINTLFFARVFMVWFLLIPFLLKSYSSIENKKICRKSVENNLDYIDIVRSS